VDDWTGDCDQCEWDGYGYDLKTKMRRESVFNDIYVRPSLLPHKPHCVIPCVFPIYSVIARHLPGSQVVYFVGVLGVWWRIALRIRQALKVVVIRLDERGRSSSNGHVAEMSGNYMQS
jgi:hypothetical protein